ncbi:non-specific lipid-transfer protein 1-like [Cucurbita maxima]|uniref:Non-specific lipid-transfer protein n=1 Tax=Cucurbita maxima TaxID=3661 RepID=A0A6J1IX25_CUCMA|nr:non-specific lipid-transfer protein 1-like [Cucurbita maxima]
MERSMKMAIVVGVVLMCMVVGEAAISCGTVASSVAPCIPYLRNPSTGLPAACCSGIRSLNSQASTSADRRTACNCLKSAANSVSGINYNAASSLPSKCGVSIPYKISPSTDCNKVN